MIKHGASHGLSVLVSTILAAFIVELLKPLIPNLLERMNMLSSPLIDNMHLPITVDFLSIILLASILAILWGMFFKKRFVK